MKRIMITSCCLLLFWNSEAKKNNIEFGVGGYRFYGVIDQSFAKFSVGSIKYQRNLTKKIGIYAQYSRLPVMGQRFMVVENYRAAKESIGKLTSRGKYQYFDLGVRYKAFSYKRHCLSTLGGVSFAYGQNTYLTNVIWTEPEPGEPWGHPLYIFQESKMEGYLGGHLAVAYDYKLWKDRLNIGLEFGPRFYTNDFPFQINYGVHIGFNF